MEICYNWANKGGDFQTGVEGYLADMHTDKFPLMSMRGGATPSNVRGWGARTPIGMNETEILLL